MTLPPDDTGSAFVPDLMAELSRGHYSRLAWRRFWSRAWRRAWVNVRARPARRASTWRWIGASATLGVVVLAVGYRGDTTGSVGAALTFGLWFAATSFWVFLHQGLVRTEAGAPFDRLLWPNGLSYLRLSLAPLCVDPALDVAPHTFESAVMVGFLALVLATDQLDGILARRLHQCSRLGRLLDPLADLGILTWLTAGLYGHGLISGWLFALVLVRYPGALVGAIVLFFVRGPVPIASGAIGKVTTWTTSVTLVVTAVLSVSRPAWLEHGAVPALHAVVVTLLAFNTGYLGWRAFTWRGRRRTLG